MLLYNPEYTARPRQFPTDTDSWAYDYAGRSSAVVIEWLTLYNGDDMGPMSRYTEEQWREAFTAIGYFEAHQLDIEQVDGCYLETLRVHADIDRLISPAPGTTYPARATPPTLYRVATEAGSTLWSWMNNLNRATIMHEQREDTSIWVCHTPRHVFGSIAKTVRELDGTVLETTEYIIDPGDTVTRYEPPANSSTTDRT